MKVVTATRLTQGERKNDFCHADEDELVGFSFECQHNSIDHKCGCRRSMSGLVSRKATTTIMITERTDFTMEDLENALRASLVSGGWADVLKPEEVIEIVRDDARQLQRIAETFPVGTVLERRGDRYAVRSCGPKHAATESSLH